jgi:hypothetical protein
MVSLEVEPRAWESTNTFNFAKPGTLNDISTDLVGMHRRHEVCRHTVKLLLGRAGKLHIEEQMDSYHGT